MQLIVAEKPSVAQSIAAVLGANKKESGYISGNGYVVSWCVGHLVELALARMYDERYGKWQWDDLPILPDEFRYMVCDSTIKQFNLLKRLMNDSRIDEIVCATDAGREGELIFRLVYMQCGCRKPIKRLWTSSLEENAIRNGFQNLHDGKEYENLYQAALCRAQADWLVGINASRLYSLMYGQKLSVGRVMSPTLALIVEREAAISAFRSEPYYAVQIDCGFQALTARIQDKAEAEHIMQMCDSKPASVKSIDKAQKAEKPPKLYDLTTLQREANRAFGYTAQQTLDYAQALYEKKLLSYPRTDSRFLTDDMSGMLSQLVTDAAAVFPFTAGLKLDINPAQVINSDKVSDHHAIIPTQSMAKSDIASLPAGEMDILQMVSVRLLCSVGKAYTYDETTVKLDCEGYEFACKGKAVTQMGWRIPQSTYLGSIGARIQKERGDKECSLPELKVGRIFGTVNASIKEGKTTPPKHYTEESLLAAMETAGAEDMPDDAERKGLGTPATRAGILEKLVAVGFVERKGDNRTKHLIPTDKGTALITVLPEQLQSPLLTADWEQRLKRIERGEEEAAQFMSDIRGMVIALAKEAKPISNAQTLFPSQQNGIGTCPNCGMNVYETPKGYVCGNKGCRFGIWHNSKWLSGKGIRLTANQASELLSKGRIMLKGLQSKRTGKSYDATLVLECNENGYARYGFEFGKRASEKAQS